MKKKIGLYKEAINKALNNKELRFPIIDLINQQFSDFPLVVKYDNDFYEAMVDEFKDIHAEDSKGKEDELSEFIRSICQEGVLIKKNAKMLLNQLKILKTLRYIAQQRLTTDPLLVLDSIYSVESKKTYPQLIEYYNSLRSSLIMKIEDSSIKEIFLPRDQREQNEQLEAAPVNNNIPQGQEIESGNFDTILEKIYLDQRLDDKELENLMNEVDFIRVIISKMNFVPLGISYLTVQPYGSTVSGLSQKSSDADVSINTESYIQVDEFLTILKEFIESYFTTNKQDDVKLEVIVAKTPVLNYNRRGIHLDICVNNILGCVNSRMLKSLTDIDPIISKLGIVIKTWAKQNQLSTKDSLSSYSFILMMFNFLFKQQYLNSFFIEERKRHMNNSSFSCKIKRFKHKLEEIFTTNLFVTSGAVLKKEFEKTKQQNPSWKSISDFTIGELFEQFIIFYANTDESHRVISLDNHGDFQTKNSEYYFNIEDPFDNMHNPGQKSKGMDQVYINAFQKALNLIKFKEYNLLFPKN